MNLPNKLSVMRVALVPVMMIFPSFIHTERTIGGINLSIFIFLILFIIASITDFLDGKIARKYNLITDFGKFIDPLADKIVVMAALLVLVEYSMLPAWIVTIIIVREFAVSGYRLIEAKNGEVVAASKLGKLKTMTQMIGIVLLFLTPFKFMAFVHVQKYNFNTYTYILNMLGSIIFTISVIATIISGWDYLKHLKPILKDA